MSGDQSAGAIPSTAQAVAASVACARAQGLPADDPEVIAEGYSVRVRLRPAPIVTRVVTLGREMRPNPLPWMEREVSVARHLATAGLSVVAPWHEAGPFVVDGLEVSLWQWAEEVPGTVGAAEFGTALGQLHDALSDYPGELPTLVGPFADISAGLAVSSDATLQRAAAELLPLALSWPRRPLHGDAHTGNLMVTSSGPRWTDFEDVCRGPVEWDLASLTVTDEMLAAYPGPGDQARLVDCRDLRRLQILASLLVAGQEDVPLRQTVASRLDARAGA